MSETLALFRYGIIKDRLWVLLIVGIVAVGQMAVAILASFAFRDSYDTDMHWALLMLVTWPIAILALLIFNFSEDSNLTESGSGYSHWLLRMPIADWKLASVPIALKAAVIFLITLSTAIHVYFFDSASISAGFAQVGLSFLNANIWLMAATWHPFRSVWRRVVGLCVGAIVLYSAFMATMCATFDTRMQPWFRDYLAEPAKYFQVIGIALGIGYAFRAIRVARTNSHGLVNPLAKSSDRNETDVKARVYGSPQMGLLAHDLQRSRTSIVRSCLLGYVPGIVFFGCVLPFRIDALICVAVLFLYVGFIAASQVLLRTESKAFPTYLIASPLGSATIAWTRATTYVSIILIAMTGIIFTFGVWMLWPENRTNWAEWSAKMAESTGQANAGLQITLAVAIGAFALAASQTAATLWAGFTARFWVQLTTIIAYSICLLIPVGLITRWFFYQKTWEQARESALAWLDFLLPFVFVLIAIKLILTGISIALLKKFELVRGVTVIKVVLAWSAICIALGVTMHLLIPVPAVTLFWSIAYTVALVPLARILLMPVAFHWGRHR